MNFLNFSKSIKRVLSAFLLISLFHVGLSAQQSAVSVKYNAPSSSSGSNEYTFYTEGLNAGDLVFYRFSDGYEISQMQTPVNSSAAVKRVITYANPNLSVSAYVARKGGPSNIVVGTTTIEGATFGTLPNVLSASQYIKLKGSSWRPFVDPAMPTVLTDNKTTPTFFTPNKPWFILSIALKTPLTGGYAEIIIPAGATVTGVLLKNQWISFNTSSPVFNPDPHVINFTNLPGKLKVDLNSASSGQEFNLYLVLETSTKIGDDLFFESSIYAQGNGGLHTKHSSHSMSLTTVKNPHDPNALNAFEDEICPGQSVAQDLRYRVDFQNMGAGEATNVSVKVTFDPKIVADPQPSLLEFSHPISSTTTSTIHPATLTINFNGIDLQGLNNYPQPLYDETRGWVEFTVHSVPCINTSSSIDPYGIGIHTQQTLDALAGINATYAEITFENPSNSFSETIQTGFSIQHLRESCEPDPACGRPRERAQFINDNSVDLSETSAPVCYPSPVEDRLEVQIPMVNENGIMNVSVRDLNGIEHTSQMFNMSGGQAFQCSLETQNLIPGMYLVYLSQGKTQFVKKIIKI